MSAELVLAAIDRATRQSQRPVTDTSASEIARHLGVSRRSGAWREALAHLRELEDAGRFERRRRNGGTVWALTSSGRRRLARAVAADDGLVLPESPQHARWRNARRLARQELPRCQSELAATLTEAARLLDDQQAESADWFALAARLTAAAERVGAIAFCLTEWPEPNEREPDRSEGPRVLRLARFGKDGAADA